MKTKHWIKAMTATLLLCSAIAGAGEKGGNGGGGIRRNGTYLTFGSANMHAGLDPLDQVPGLDLLAQSIRKLKIHPIQRAQLLNVILPDGHRNYFSIKESDLDGSKRQAFLKAYQSVISEDIPPSDLVVFAATSRDTAETYLLPEFFQLKPVEQAAILFHEALWLVMPVGTPYNFVIDAEIKFQKYLERGGVGYDSKFYPVLDEVFKDHMLSLKVAFLDDYASGALDDVLIENGNEKDSRNGKKVKSLLPLKTLFKLDIEIRFSGEADYDRSTDSLRYSCAVSYYRIEPARSYNSAFSKYEFTADIRITDTLAEAMNAHPKSKAIRRLYEIRNILTLRTDSYQSPEKCQSFPIGIDLSTIEKMPQVTISAGSNRIGFLNIIDGAQ